MKTIFTLVSLFVMLISSAQETKDDSPKNAVEAYFNGYKKGDIEILKEVFHPSFYLSWISPWAQGSSAFKQVDREGMFAFFGPDWKKNKISCEILNIEKQESMAFVKANVQIEGIVTWYDYISLLKIDGKWWIISKVSTGKT